MLSTQYRLRLTAICKDIGAGVEVSLEDMIWAEKLAKANTAARGMLQTARRISTDPTDSFLNELNIGDPDSTHHVRGFGCLLYTSPSPRDGLLSRMPSSA